MRLNNDQLLPATLVRFIFQAVMLIILPKNLNQKRKFDFFTAIKQGAVKVQTGWQFAHLSLSQYPQPYRTSQKTSIEKNTLGRSSKTVSFYSPWHENFHIYLNSVFVLVSHETFRILHLISETIILSYLHNFLWVGIHAFVWLIRGYK